MALRYVVTQNRTATSGSSNGIALWRSSRLSSRAADRADPRVTGRGRAAGTIVAVKAGPP